MSDTWEDAQGKLWVGYWLTKLDGSWGYSLHPEGADTDMADCSMAEVEESFGPLKNGIMIDTEERVIRKRFRATS